MSKQSASEIKQETWINNKWRPMMAWLYFVVCAADFIVFPILWSILQAVQQGKVFEQWDPITLQGAGLFHLAMGAILGIAAWSRGQEKISDLYRISPSRRHITETEEDLGPLRGDLERRKDY